MSNYWGQKSYNELEIVITNLVSGIYANPFDPVLLVDNIRDYVLGQLNQQFNCTNKILVRNVKTNICYEINESLLKPIKYSIGSLQDVFFKAVLQKTFLDGNLYVIDKRLYSEERLIIYTVDLTHDKNFITPLLIIKDENNETFTIDLGHKDDLIFVNAGQYESNALRRILFTSGLLKGQLVDLFPIDFLCVGNHDKLYTCTQKFKDLGIDTLKDILLNDNIILYQICGTTDYFTLPSFEAANICLFDRGWTD